MSTTDKAINQKSTKTFNKIRALRLNEVIKRSGLSRATIYKKIQEGTFPLPVKLGERAVGWIEGEFEYWLKSRPRINQKNA